MTDHPDLDHHGEQAAAELAKRLQRIVPSSFLADPLAFARRYWTDAVAEGWRHVPPPAPLAHAGTGAPPDAHADELEAVRRRCAEASRAWQEALTRKDTP